MEEMISMRKTGSIDFLYRMVSRLGWAMLLLMLIGGTAFGAGRTLKGVGLIDADNEFKILIMAADQAPIADYRLAYLHFPSRLLVDLEGKWDFPGYTEVKAENHIIKRIRVGEHPDKLRIAVDLKNNMVLSPIIEEMPGAIALVIREEYIQRTEGPTEAGKGKMSDIRMEEMPGQIKITLSGDRPIREYKSYMISNEDPPKFVIDISGKWINEKGPAIDIDSDLVKRIRIGEHADFLRIVTELNTSRPITPVIGKSDHNLVLTIKQ